MEIVKNFHIEKFPAGKRRFGLKNHRNFCEPVWFNKDFHSQMIRTDCNTSFADLGT